MKRLLLILSLFVSSFTFAQKIQFGVKAGANISNFTGGDFKNVDKKALIGFHGGPYLRISFLNIALQPEATISTQGARIDSVSGSYDWKVTYVNVPVMLQVKLSPLFYIEAGPQFGFKVSENSGDQTFNDMDLAIAGGLGIRTGGGLGLGARYTAGLSKVGDFDASSNIDPDFKNGVVQVSLYIPLTK
ncbi:MAG: outer membrane beta-barrel protein [Chitinophagaceae bacterium]